MRFFARFYVCAARYDHYYIMTSIMDYAKQYKSLTMCSSFPAISRTPTRQRRQTHSHSNGVQREYRMNGKAGKNELLVYRLSKVLHFPCCQSFIAHHFLSYYTRLFIQSSSSIYCYFTFMFVMLFLLLGGKRTHVNQFQCSSTRIERSVSIF